MEPTDLAAMGYKVCAHVGCRQYTKIGLFCKEHRWHDYISAEAGEQKVVAINQMPAPERGRSLSIHIPGPPVPAARPRVNTETGRAYTPKRYAEWKKRAAGVVARAVEKAQPLVGTVEAEVLVAEDGIWVTLTEVNQPRPKRLKGDIDNYLKGALDAATQGGAIADDSDVVDTKARFW